MLRLLLQAHLDLRRPGAATGPVSDADGGVRSRAQIQTRGVESVTVARTGYTGAHVPKQQLEQLVVRAAEDFDAFYEMRHDCAQADPHTGPIQVLTVDGKGVVMRPEDLREATRRAASPIGSPWMRARTIC